MEENERGYRYSYRYRYRYSYRYRYRCIYIYIYMQYSGAKPVVRARGDSRRGQAPPQTKTCPTFAAGSLGKLSFDIADASRILTSLPKTMLWGGVGK